MEYAEIISAETGLKKEDVEAVAAMLDDGATIWFIARYRKEKTGSMDEVAITGIRDQLQSLRALSERKAAILKSLADRDLLTPELEAAVGSAAALNVLEDLYEKFRPKRRTRAMAAREKGLAPLAGLIQAQKKEDLARAATAYIDPDKGVPDLASALDGARDIIAETINEDARIRSDIRRLFLDHGVIQSRVKKGKEEDGAKFRDYFDWAEPAFKAPSHRVHAMLRGQAEAALLVHLLPDEDRALQMLSRHCLRHPSKTDPKIREQMVLAVKDAYKRLLSKSLEKECLARLKTDADTRAIAVFARNLKELLLSPPMGEKRIMAIDPGFRTGCKVACLDAQGQLLAHDLIFLHKEAQAVKTLGRLAAQYRPQAIAVGNGTAGRETEALVRKLVGEKVLDSQIDVVMVDESGASVYSASQSARDEFPDHDITVRGAVSIGRRLMDPLAELVKIDPKSIGVGQYQHDVDQALLRSALDDTVKSCVNQVGVEANTASPELLSQVSGLNRTIATNLTVFRNENGPFASRRDLLKVPRLGPKAYEQAAGFLRIRNGKNPLDNSGIHPESYPIARAMARDMGLDVMALAGRADALADMDLAPYVTADIGLPTLEDIVRELASPGRDPRQPFQAFAFDETVQAITDLVPGMVLPGIVTNVTAFGAFVDIGVHQDGLVHISQMADRFVKDPNEVVSVRQQVRVRVLDVDRARKRISLSMKKKGES